MTEREPSKAIHDEDVPLKSDVFLIPHILREGHEEDSSYRGSPPRSRRSSGIGFVGGGHGELKTSQLTLSRPRPSSLSSSSVGTAQQSGNSGSSKQGSHCMLHTHQDGSIIGLPSAPGMEQTKWYYVWSSKIINNKYVTAFMMFLTVYALSGDDVRLLATNKPADMIFNVFTILCLLFFSIECVLSCLGKDDYWLGFFFFLDVVSTLTLIMDLTWVSEQMMGDEDDLNRARSGRTARMGAKVGRIVRVIRLIRIVKLYKAYYDSRSKRKKKKVRIDPITGEEVSGAPGDYDDDDWGDDGNADATAASPQQESHVAKQLSALTTRRVIVLVLTMLLGLPLLSADESQRTPASPAYGADDVYGAFLDMEIDGTLRLTYERTMLRYLYYHNWFLRHTDCPRTGPQQGCSNTYLSQVFWVGVSAKDATVRSQKASAAKLRPGTVAQWEINVTSQDYAYNYGTMPAHAVQTISSPWTQECTVSTSPHLGFSLLADYEGFKVKCPNDLRTMERSKWNPRMLTLDDYTTWHLSFYFDLRPQVRAESKFSIWLTCFVCIVLCVASVMFSKDASELVLDPVETMIAKVNMIRQNPLIALKIADNEFKLEEQNKAKQARMDKERVLTFVKNILFCRASNQEVMETAILDRTIIKLGTLLALGFGEAGANIVSHNISNSAGVNAMIEGMRITCILGNARIEEFSVATEVLQGRVMTFVNQIAEIVHGVITEFGGAANRNNGETFLLIWRLGDYLEPEQEARVADMAMVAFTSVLGVIHRSIVLATYRGHPGLQQRLGQNHRVNLSFGLHHGWAIEGAVGTEYKIDASYLSPHVSITESVLQSTSIYGVPFVASEAVVDMMSKPIACKFRLIDKVVIKGSKFPMCLYCLDLDYMSLMVDEPKQRLYVWNPRQRYRARQLLEAEKNRKQSEEVSVSDIFNESQDIAIMRRRFTEEFLQFFNMGYQNYYEGEWAVARRLLSHTRDLLGIPDGPSLALLRFMETFRFEAPRGWQGFHEFGGGCIETVECPDMPKDLNYA